MNGGAANPEGASAAGLAGGASGVLLTIVLRSLHCLNFALCCMHRQICGA